MPVWSYRIAGPCGSCDRSLCRACSAEMRAAVSCKPAPNFRRGGDLRYGRLSLAPRCVFSTWLGCELENCCGLRRPIVDLETGALHIRHSKFNKSRLVPLAPDLVQRIVQCRVARSRALRACSPRHAAVPQPARETVFDHRAPRRVSRRAENRRHQADNGSAAFGSMTCAIPLRVFGFCCGVNRMSISARSCHSWPHISGMSDWPARSATSN